MNRKGTDKKALSNILDIYEEEQIRGKTFEISSFNVQHNNFKYTFIDTPGHKIYIRQYIQARTLVSDCSYCLHMDPSLSLGLTRERQRSTYL